MSYIGLFNIQPTSKIENFGTGNIYTTVSEINSLHYADNVLKLITKSKEEAYVAPIVIDNVSIDSSQTFQGIIGECFPCTAWGPSLYEVTANSEFSFAGPSGTLEYNTNTKDVKLITGTNFLEYVIPGIVEFSFDGQGPYAVEKVLNSEIIIINKFEDLLSNDGTYTSVSFTTSYTMPNLPVYAFHDSNNNIYIITSNTNTGFTISNPDNIEIGLND
ncbi:hypothetical protein H8D85_00975 [bacterium]|nr:hypothetical protein [bacterium]